MMIYLNIKIFDLKEFKVKANQILFSFKNRIFGVDSLMVLVSDENKSFKLLNDALKEKYQPGKTSFLIKLDRIIIQKLILQI